MGSRPPVAPRRSKGRRCTADYPLGLTGASRRPRCARAGTGPRTWNQQGLPRLTTRRRQRHPRLDGKARVKCRSWFGAWCPRVTARPLSGSAALRCAPCTRRRSSLRLARGAGALGALPSGGVERGRGSSSHGDARRASSRLLGRIAGWHVARGRLSSPVSPRGLPHNSFVGAVAAPHVDAVRRGAMRASGCPHPRDEPLSEPSPTGWVVSHDVLRLRLADQRDRHPGDAWWRMPVAAV